MSKLTRREFLKTFTTAVGTPLLVKADFIKEAEHEAKYAPPPTPKIKTRDIKNGIWMIRHNGGVYELINITVSIAHAFSPESISAWKSYVIPGTERKYETIECKIIATQDKLSHLVKGRLENEEINYYLPPGETNLIDVSIYAVTSDLTYEVNENGHAKVEYNGNKIFVFNRR